MTTFRKVLEEKLVREEAGIELALRDATVNAEKQQELAQAAWKKVEFIQSRQEALMVTKNVVEKAKIIFEQEQAEAKTKRKPRKKKATTAKAEGSTKTPKLKPMKRKPGRPKKTATVTH